MTATAKDKPPFCICCNVQPRGMGHFEKPSHIVQETIWEMRQKGYTGVGTTHPFLNATCPQVLKSAPRSVITGTHGRERAVQNGWYAPSWLVYLAGMTAIRPTVRKRWVMNLLNDPDELAAYQVARALGANLLPYFQDKGWLRESEIPESMRSLQLIRKTGDLP